MILSFVLCNVCLKTDILQQRGRPRPLIFDENHHKILNSELKHLYTAITRARVNVWIFDEDMEKRAPMFDYVKARNLAKFVTIKDDDNESKQYDDTECPLLFNFFLSLLLSLTKRHTCLSVYTCPHDWIRNSPLIINCYIRI